MREVYINNKRVDVEESSEIGYIFTSPIFRDLTKIFGNRTTTYKLPKTARNLAIIGNTDMPDVRGKFPYQKHEILEYRDGFPFIKGECSLLGVNENNIELQVLWGNPINLQKLKDINLRDLNKEHCVDWNSDSTFLKSSDTEQAGFIRVDLGRGFNGITKYRHNPMKYVYPSVTIQYILDLIVNSTNVSFDIPDRFYSVFTKTWIPLLDYNAIESQSEGAEATFYLRSANKKEVAATPFPNKNGSGNFKDRMMTQSLFRIGYSGRYTLALKGPVTLKDVPDGKRLAITHQLSTDEDIRYYGIPYSADTNKATVNIDEVFEFDRTKDVDIDYATASWMEMYIVNDDDSVYRHLNFATSLNDEEEIINASTSRPDEVLIKGDYRINLAKTWFGMNGKYYITPNLPDMKVTDFLKAVMNMYGLFAYYDMYKDNEIQFLAIDDMYLEKDKAEDWTHRILDSGSGRITTSYTYSDYAQENTFKYKNDKDVVTDADGILPLENNAIPEGPKEIVALPFSATDNISEPIDINQMWKGKNEYAKIKLFEIDKENDKTSVNSVTTRVLREKEFIGEEDISYKSGIFNEFLHFGTPDGLLNKYYEFYQKVLKNPIVIKCSVKFDSVDLYNFKERYPVIIDGNYYMPINVTIDTKGAANCELILMP
ncbi:hypothetical protein [Dysgonomonas sp. 520]|uniref:hypothetical protein n=1 Tax=Dysgonomonas sp. 520 TaxID=2302931 RepID=UPI0013D6F4E4|nr:hypothetical protein [Dysgonomonas sp. 520]NDW09497.1 hypothetical protein [Dysgonomonas sp. 520]